MRDEEDEGVAISNAKVERRSSSHLASLISDLKSQISDLIFVVIDTDGTRILRRRIASIKRGHLRRLPKRIESAVCRSEGRLNRIPLRIVCKEVETCRYAVEFCFDVTEGARDIPAEVVRITSRRPVDDVPETCA